jgi:hypothetical protein
MPDSTNSLLLSVHYSVQWVHAGEMLFQASGHLPPRTQYRIPLCVRSSSTACPPSGNRPRSAEKATRARLYCPTIACNTRQPSRRRQLYRLFLANGGAHGTACIPSIALASRNLLLDPSFLSRIAVSISRHLYQRRLTIRHPATRQTGPAMRAQTRGARFRA